MNNIGSVAVSLLEVKICLISAWLRIKAIAPIVTAKWRIHVNSKYMNIPQLPN